MRPDIHPKYHQATVTCSCGSTFVTGSTKPELRIEICSNCHPFYSGKQKFIDTGGRVDRFAKRYQKFNEAQAKKAEEDAAKAALEAESAEESSESTGAAEVTEAAATAEAPAATEEASASAGSAEQE